MLQKGFASSFQGSGKSVGGTGYLGEMIWNNKGHTGAWAWHDQISQGKEAFVLLLERLKISNAKRGR